MFYFGLKKKLIVINRAMAEATAKEIKMNSKGN